MTKRRVIETVSNYHCNLSKAQALESLNKEYPTIPWKYYGWSSHNDSYVFDAIVDEKLIPKGMTSYETTTSRNDRVAEAIKQNKTCDSCKFFDSKISCKNNSNTQLVISKPIPKYYPMTVAQGFICIHFKE